MYNETIIERIDLKYKDNARMLTAAQIQYAEIKRKMIKRNPFITMAATLPEMTIVARLIDTNIFNFDEATKTFDKVINSIYQN